MRSSDSLEWNTTITVFDICHTVWRPAWLIKGTITWHLHLFCGYDNSCLIRLCEISCPLGARSVTLNHSFPAPNYSHSNPHRPLLPYHTYRHTHTPPSLTSAYLSNVLLTGPGAQIEPWRRRESTSQSPWDPTTLRTWSLIWKRPGRRVIIEHRWSTSCPWAQILPVSLKTLPKGTSSVRIT